MEADGGCYCGAVRYHLSGEFLMKMLCYCRECQHASGGAGTVAAVVPQSAFAYTRGEPGRFTRSDIAAPVTREFCRDCGTPLLSRSPQVPGAVIVKAGTLDDPALFGQADSVIFAGEKQVYHACPEGVPVFQTVPSRG
ncbi:GFA family protein [Novosphingobium bradum]|uniref:GFA family protein n=1 Tax=Novosphingobium bradum TaxID=1737444 RepID=A0ABV7IM88_9SPHN